MQGICGTLSSAARTLSTTARSAPVRGWKFSMEDNLSFMENFQPLTGAERAVVDKVRAALDKVPQIPCTACSYCTKGCPQSINIPGIFKAMNNQLIYGNRAGAVGNYSFATRTGGKASDCIACGQCEAACPQHIEIIEELKKAVEMFEG